MTRRGQQRARAGRMQGPPLRRVKAAVFNQPAPGTPGTPVPVTAYGPYPVMLSGFAGPAHAFGCAASVRTPSATLAAWASVAADGSAYVSWYTAPWTTSQAAELEAIHGALQRCPPAGTSTPPGVILTDSTPAAQVARDLAEGEWPLRQGFGNYPHRDLLAATRDECLARAAVITVAGGDRRSASAPAGPALAAARQLAQLTRRLAASGIPVDDNSEAMLRSLVRAGRSHSPRQLADLYQEWAGSQR